MSQNLELLQSFDIHSLPDLDVVTLGALDLFSEAGLPAINFKQFSRPLVVGSGNAAATGRLLFDDVDAVFADESTFLNKLAAVDAIDGAFLLSASGGKHAIEIVKVLAERSLLTILITNNPDAPANEFLPDDAVRVFPKNREPYTYNTSTYMGMILSKTHEDPALIASFIDTEVLPLIPPDFASHEAFYFIIPSAFSDVREMFKTKFDELFGPKLMARIFTVEQTKHAKTVIPLDSELFVSFGEKNDLFGKPQNRLHIPLPEDADYAAMMAVGYFVIGHIQKQFPPYYKERIVEYTEETSEMFGSLITPIVE